MVIVKVASGSTGKLEWTDILARDQLRRRDCYLVAGDHITTGPKGGIPSHRADVKPSFRRAAHRSLPTSSVTLPEIVALPTRSKIFAWVDHHGKCLGASPKASAKISG